MFFFLRWISWLWFWLTNLLSYNHMWEAFHLEERISLIWLQRSLLVRRTCHRPTIYGLDPDTRFVLKVSKHAHIWPTIPKYFVWPIFRRIGVSSIVEANVYKDASEICIFQILDATHASITFMQVVYSYNTLSDESCE